MSSCMHLSESIDPATFALSLSLSVTTPPAGIYAGFPSIEQKSNDNVDSLDIWVAWYVHVKVFTVF